MLLADTVLEGAKKGAGGDRRVCRDDAHVSRRDQTRKRNRRNRFWHVFPARQVFAKLGPSQLERSSAEDQRLCVRLADTTQHIAGNLWRPTSFIPLTKE
jgi:hypothetical protein